MEVTSDLGGFSWTKYRMRIIGLEGTGHGQELSVFTACVPGTWFQKEECNNKGLFV